MFRSFMLATAFVIAVISVPTTALAQPNPTPKRYVEHLVGADAKRHIENLQSRHVAAFVRARRLLAEKGWKETDNVQVFRTNRKLAQLRGGYAPAQYYSGPEGEVVAWEYEDGDYDTWAGTIYLVEYTTGTWMVVDCQMSLASNSEWSELWSQVVDGENRGPRDIDPVRTEPQLQRGYVRTGSSAYLQVIDWGAIRNKWSNWGSCAGRGCLGAAIACNLQNPTPQEKPDVAICTAAWCLASGVACLDNLK